MREFEKLTIRFSKKELEQIDSNLGGGTRTKLLRDAVANYVSDEDNVSNNMLKMMRQVKTLNTKTTEQKVSDLELKIQIIFEEIKKQNDIIKIIHRRSTIGANLSKLLLDEIHKSTNLSNSKQDDWQDFIEQEFNDLQLTTTRK